MCADGISRSRSYLTAMPLDGGRAHFQRGTRASVVKGETLATYSWLPTGPRRATVLLVHGFRTHIRYNFLRSSSVALHQYGGDPPDASVTPARVPGFSVDHQESFENIIRDDDNDNDNDNRKVDDETSSFVRGLNKIGVACYGHDHVGHGDSTGLRAYFPSFDALVSDIIRHARDLTMTKEAKGLPLYIMGHSMGGTASILAVMREPDLFDGMMLSSPASEPPKDMLGWRGLALSKISWLSTLFFPTLEVMPMPKNTYFPAMQRLYESDTLNSTVMLRARVGHEFLCAYKSIADSLDKVTVPFITMSGKKDTLVNPEASTRFYAGAASTDKELHIQDCWHNPLIEPGKEDNWKVFAVWLGKRLK